MMRRGRPLLPLAALAVAALVATGCEPRPQVVSPADGSAIPIDGSVDVQVMLGGVPATPDGVRVTLLRGIDAPPATAVVVSDRFTVQGATVTGTLGAEDLAPARNALFAATDADGAGRSDNLVSSTFRWDPLRAAACARVITPVVGVNHSDPIYMAGFGNDRHPTGVHDDLWARGFVLENADRKIAIVTLDVVGYFHNEVQTIRALAAAAGFEADAIMVSSTHNHEGPDTMGLWGPDEFSTGVDVGYLDFVNEQVVECLRDADAALVPAEMRFATGTTVGASLPPYPDLVADGKVLEAYTFPGELLVPPREGTVIVEGDPGEIINPTVPSLQIRDRISQETLATVINYASHPEALGSSNTLLTSDFPHFMRERLEERYGGTAIYVSADLGVLQGPLDVDVTDPETGLPAPRRTFRFAEVMGHLLADRAAAALDGVTEWQPNPPLDVRTEAPIAVLVENPFFQILASIQIFGRRLPETIGTDLAVTTEINAIRIGPAQLAVTPNEVDPQIGDLYRARMTGAEHRWIIGLGNDEIGYQMPVAKFNPACQTCAFSVLLGNVEDCPLAQALGTDVVDCNTVFSNNIGGNADPQLQERMNAALDGLNE
jgi:hypothetical protein